MRNHVTIDAIDDVIKAIKVVKPNDKYQLLRAYCEVLGEDCQYFKYHQWGKQYSTKGVKMALKHYEEQGWFVEYDSKALESILGMEP